MQLANQVLGAIIHHAGYATRSATEENLAEKDFILTEKRSKEFQAYVMMFCGEDYKGGNLPAYFHRQLSSCVKIQPSGSMLKMWKDCVIHEGEIFLNSTMVQSKLNMALRDGLQLYKDTAAYTRAVEMGTFFNIEIDYSNTLQMKSRVGDISVKISPAIRIGTTAKIWFEKHYGNQPTLAIPSCDLKPGDDPGCSWSLIFHEEQNRLIRLNRRTFELGLLFAERLRVKILTRDVILYILSLLESRKTVETSKKLDFYDFLELCISALEGQYPMNRYDKHTCNILDGRKEITVVQTICKMKQYLMLLKKYRC